MPRPNPPPTPGSSSDLRGKEGGGLVNASPTFHLPPTAYQETVDRASSSSTTPSANGSDSSYRPVSPTSPADGSRKRSAAAAQTEHVITKDDFTLPPPPTRSRKIIQMKPRETEAHDNVSVHAAASQASQGSRSTAATAAASAAAPAPAANAGGKRKQNTSGTTAAGRKIARKTAHSLIERRRRSKMNEEFGVLKDMIPACKGQEMHKLAILQASIEYLRYLEQCVADLQAQNTSPRQLHYPPAPHTTGHAKSGNAREDLYPDNHSDDDEDEEMEDDSNVPTSAPTPAHSTPFLGPTQTSTSASLEHSTSGLSLPSLAQMTTTTTTSTNSPSLFSTNANSHPGRHYSISSAASQASGYSPYIHSSQTSPAFGPQLHHLSGPQPFSNSGASFGLGSPALKPLDPSVSPSNLHALRQIAEGATELSDRNSSHHQRLPQSSSAPGSSRAEADLDHEATAALLMLNHDRRSWRAAKNAASANATATAPPPPPADAERDLRGSTGMSVRDLLSG